MRSLRLEEPVMSRFMCALVATIAATSLPNHGRSLHAQQLSEGQPHKWEAVTNKSMYDFVADGFELKSVAYDTSVLGPQRRLIPLSQVGQYLGLAGQIQNGAGFEFFGS